MTTPARSAKRSYVFGEFELDATAGELRRGVQPVPLRRKCFDLLEFFVSRPGELLSKEQLLGEVWSDVVVNDSTLSRTITELREALGDDAQEPIFIDTVPRRGYRFIAPVRAVSSTTRITAPFVLVGSSQEFPLGVGEHIIGRGREVAVVVRTPEASRHHARVVVSADSIAVEDLGSRNGTKVNGKRINDSVTLQPGDRLKIGDETFVVWSADIHNAPTADEVSGV